MGETHSTTQRDDTIGNFATGTERWVTRIWEDGHPEKTVEAYGSTPDEAQQLANEQWEENDS